MQQKRQHQTLKPTGALDYIRGVFENDGCLVKLARVTKGITFNRKTKQY